MSQVSNVADIAFSTAFLTDKICGVFNQSFDESNATYIAPVGGGTPLYGFTIPHSFGRPVFCTAIYSNDGVAYTPMGASSGGGGNSANVYSDSKNINIITLGNPGTIYCKIITIWIDNYDNTNPLVAPVLNTTNGAYFDTRANYQKVLKEGVVMLNNPGTGNTGTYNISHNLGYAPDFKLYFESLPNQVWPQINGGSANPWIYNYSTQYELFGISNDTELRLTYSGGSSSASTFRVWYKIYYDK